MTIQQIGLVDRLFMRRSRIDVNIVVECAELGVDGSEKLKGLRVMVGVSEMKNGGMQLRSCLFYLSK